MKSNGVDDSVLRSGVSGDISPIVCGGGGGCVHLGHSGS